MGGPLDGCRAKITRAREHLGSLKHEIDSWLARQTNVLVVERDGEWEVVRARQEPPPLVIATIAGDLIHNARSCLDHLAWQLVLISGGKPTGKTIFPIYGAKADFVAAVEKPKKARDSPLRGIPVGGPIWTEIERLQPYNAGDIDTDKLSQLSILSRIDKHRMLHVVHMFPADRGDVINSVEWNADAILLEKIEPVPLKPIDDGTEIVRMRFDPAGPSPNVHVETQVAVVVALGDESRAVTILGLEQIIERVEGVVGTFDHFFP